MRVRSAGRVPVAGPGGEIDLIEEVLGEAPLDLVDRTVADDVCELSQVLTVDVSLRARFGRMILSSRAERLKLACMRDLAHQAHIRGELVVESSSAELHAVVAVELDIEAWKGRVPDAHARLAFVFEVSEEVQPIAKDRTARGKCDLLVVDGNHSIQHRVFGVESATAKVSPHRTGQHIRTGARDRADLHA